MIYTRGAGTLFSVCCYCITRVARWKFQ